MKLKIGQKIKIKSVDWYNKNKDKEGDIHIGPDFVCGMERFCGKTLTIDGLWKRPKGYYYIKVKETFYTFCDAFIEDKSIIRIKIN